MTRGKYAARAAQGRAEAAGQRADRTADALTAEREAHAAEVTALKTRIEMLSAQLTGTVADLAAQEVRSVEAACAEKINADRQRHHDGAIKAFQRLGRAVAFDAAANHWHIPNDNIAELIADMAQALGIPAGQADEAATTASGFTSGRAQRRANASRAKNAAHGRPIIALRGPRQ